MRPLPGRPKKGSLPLGGMARSAEGVALSGREIEPFEKE